MRILRTVSNRVREYLDLSQSIMHVLRICFFLKWSTGETKYDLYFAGCNIFAGCKMRRLDKIPTATHVFYMHFTLLCHEIFGSNVFITSYFELKLTWHVTVSSVLCSQGRTFSRVRQKTFGNKGIFFYTHIVKHLTFCNVMYMSQEISEFRHFVDCLELLAIL